MSQSTKYSESGRDPTQLADGELNAFEKELYLKHQAMDTSGEGITIADARLPDMPIIYVNAAFYRMTGYTTQEIIGRNCRFLPGAETEVATVEEIRVALRQKREITVEILNYRKNMAVVTVVRVNRDADDLIARFAPRNCVRDLGFNCF